jgi:integrase
VRTSRPGHLVADLPEWFSLTCVIFDRCAVLYGQNQATSAWPGEFTRAGPRWDDTGLAFTTRYGTALSPANVRRDVRKAIKSAPGVDARDWTPRELRHSFVSLLSDSGIPVEEISRLVGHKSTVVTELVYRKQIRPVLQGGADVMDRIFGPDEDA